jgi:protein TonB
MYEAMRQCAPFSTRAAGVTATALLASAAGYVLLTGFGAAIVKAVQRPMTVISLAPPPSTPTDPPPAKFDKIDELLPAPSAPTDPMPLDKFYYDETTSDGGDRVVGTSSHVDPPPQHTPVLTRPKMKPADPPPYPPIAIRGDMQGTSAISICIDAKGRVTSASLARSSGHDVLDEAALKWVRNARFSPGLSDGAPQAVCDHPVEYVWNLETLRR